MKYLYFLLLVPFSFEVSDAQTSSRSLSFSEYLKISADHVPGSIITQYLWTGNPVSGGPANELLILDTRFQGSASSVIRASLIDLSVTDVHAGPVGNSLFGYESMLADINMDGIPDFVTGDEEFDGRGGACWIVSGASGSVFGVYRGQGPGDGFGRKRTVIGDIDADGWLDLLVSSEGADPGGIFNAGSVYLVSTRTGDVLWTQDGTGHAELFPSALEAIGDLDRDGFMDFAIGSSRATVNGERKAGRVWVYSGRNLELIHRFEGSQENEFFGDGILALGDVNFDGVPEMVVSSYSDFVLNLTAFCGVNGNRLWNIVDRDGFRGLPYQGRDHNSDGVADFWTAINLRVELHSGDDGRLLSSFPVPNQNVGVNALAALQDVTGDGLDDVVFSQAPDQVLYFYQMDSLTLDSNNSLGSPSDEIRLNVNAPALDSQSVFVLYALSVNQGTELLGRRIPLDDDALFRWSLSNPTVVSLGRLGRGTTALTLPPGIEEASLTIHASYIALDAQSPGSIKAVSNAVELTR